MKYATGAQKSPYDIRTFAYVPTKANVKGGTRYSPEDIEDQHKVGICTSISLTMEARKVFGIDFSDDFQYLIQKKYVDKNWGEGSSAFSALRVGRGAEDKDGNFLWGGFLPEKDWTFTTIEDRKLPYYKYIKKLQAIPDSEIEKLFEISQKYRLSAYAKVPVDRDMMADAIDESAVGIITRFAIDKNWYTAPIEPLRKPSGSNTITGHLVTTSNYNGGSFRIANSWGKDWADGGTAYYLLKDYSPTEAWIAYFGEIPPEIEVQKDNRATIIGKIMDLLQQIIALLPKLA